MNLLQKLFRCKNVDEPINSALNKPAVIRRAYYDKSTKEFEVLRITYRWDKYGRKLSNEPKWHHYRYYKTLNSALDAIKDIRNSRYDKAYYDYPAMNGGIEHERKYPHIKPTITIHRYKIARRDDLPCV
jgi:hypothetical protein